ncbi:heavy metal-associated isoprenylated plant protein 43-like [Miscanthus floridulus]|uniref:heavy metal-associated isoprenylated plant protein 43-like n=1 Tax=Miscanthus floridulus TaxID=154761 RepID=UPI00345788ED
MSKKIVIKADLIGDKCKSEILAIVSKNQGIKSMEIDTEKCTLTVVGTVDPVRIVQKLKKKCFEATIVSVEDDKPTEKKDPCKEACEKLCKEKCDKITCCKECKEKCEKKCKDKCEKACEAWLGKGCCSCSRCKPSPSCYYDPCAVPSYYPYGYYNGCASRPYPYYGCYEERSHEGACTIQ